MRHFLLLLVSAITIFAFGNQRIKTVSLSFNSADFQLSTIDGKTHISSNVHDLLFDESDTVPKIPQIGINVLIGPNESFDSLKYVFSDSCIWNGIDIAACEYPVITGFNSGQPIISRSAGFSETYHSSLYYYDTAVMDGYKFLKLIVKPFSYNGNDSILTLNQNVSINLYISQNSQIQSPHGGVNFVGGELMREYVADITVNGEELNEQYGDPIAATSHLDSIRSYPYLLITNENMKSAFQPLANWKTIKGMRAKILTVEEIDTLYSGSTAPIRIKTAIKDYKENHFTKYVLLGGDENVVPGQLCYLEYKTTEKTLRDTVCSDLFYVCLKDIDWDTNGDGIAAQLDKANYIGDDSININPSIIVSRLPADSIARAQAMVTKIIDYEREPLHGEWTDNILLTGTVIDTVYTYNDRDESDSERIGQEIYNYLRSKGWNGNITRFFDTYTDMPSGADYNVTYANMRTELEKGYTLVHEESHGSFIRWILEKSSFYCINAKHVNNKKKGTVIVTAACSTNGYDKNDECLSQAFLQSSKSGVVAYYGSQREGFRDQSANLNKLFINRLLNSSYHRYGNAAIFARNDYVQDKFNKGYNTTRWLTLAVNPMGDPEMPVYMSEPLQRTGIVFSFHNNVLTISTNDSVAYKACVTSLVDNGNSYYLTTKSINGRASFLGVPDSSRVCITSPGYIPYVVDVYKDVYIQNETFTENRLIVADQTYIGKNVTDQLSQGPVIIESGNVEIQSAGGVLLAPETEVRHGATLVIKTK